MGVAGKENTMRRALTFISLFALAQLGSPPGSFSASLQTDTALAARGGGAGGEMHGGRGSAPGGEVGGRHEGEERGEHREFREHGEHQRHKGHDGDILIIGPGWGYYPEDYPYYQEPPDYYGPPPPVLLYCEDPTGYYPGVTQCPGGWEEIPAEQER